MPRVKNPLDITQKVAQIIHSDDALPLQSISKTLKDAMGCNVVSIYVCQEDGYLMVANVGFKDDYVNKLTLQSGRGLVHHIVKTGKTLCLSDANTHQSFYYVQGLGEEKYHGFIGAPVLKQGKVIGALIFQFIKNTIPPSMTSLSSRP